MRKTRRHRSRSPTGLGRCRRTRRRRCAAPGRRRHTPTAQIAKTDIK